jgi:hypothetical protein
LVLFDAKEYNEEVGYNLSTTVNSLLPWVLFKSIINWYRFPTSLIVGVNTVWPSIP